MGVVSRVCGQRRAFGGREEVSILTQVRMGVVSRVCGQRRAFGGTGPQVGRREEGEGCVASKVKRGGGGCWA